MLNFIMLCRILFTIMMNVIMLSVTILSVVMLSVIAPKGDLYYKHLSGVSDDGKQRSQVPSDSTIRYVCVTLQSSVTLVKNIYSTSHSGYLGKITIVACL